MVHKILVLGATGMLGRPVAQSLHEEGFQVRVLTRDIDQALQLFDEEFEIVVGDITDIQSLERAMEGCDGVHISVGGPIDFQSVDNVVALAPGLGLGRLTYISGSSVCEQNGWFPMTAAKLKAEKAIINSRLPYTIFRPTWPLEQLPRFVVNGQAVLVGDEPIAWRWFAAEDLGRMVANAYLLPQALNQDILHPRPRTNHHERSPGTVLPGLPSRNKDRLRHAHRRRPGLRRFQRQPDAGLLHRINGLLPKSR